MISLDERTAHEVEHGRMLAQSGDPELIWHWNTPAGRVRAQRRAQLLAQAADLHDNQTVLEVGCGTGLFTELLSRSGAKIIAIDISPDLLELAKKRDLPRDQVEFRLTRFEDGQLEGNYDAVLGSSVLHHLEISTALQRMYDLLKPGGHIAFAEPNLLNPIVWAERKIEFVRIKRGVSEDETAIVRWKLAQDLVRCGFTDVRIANVDWLHPKTPRPLIPVLYTIGLGLEKIPLIKEFSGSVLIHARKPL